MLATVGLNDVGKLEEWEVVESVFFFVINNLLDLSVVQIVKLRALEPLYLAHGNVLCKCG